MDSYLRDKLSFEATVQSSAMTKELQYGPLYMLVARAGEDTMKMYLRYR